MLKSKGAKKVSKPAHSEYPPYAKDVKVPHGASKGKKAKKEKK
jgi:hypothetical protein